MQDYRIFQVKVYDNYNLFLSEEEKCPECEGIHFELDAEYNICCRSCGLVLSSVCCYVGGVKLDLPSTTLHTYYEERTEVTKIGS